jgi:hypothetical protein
MTLCICPTKIIPRPIPTPTAVTRMPHAVGPPFSDPETKMGPTDITAPAPVKAITMPIVIARTKAWSFRNRTPSVRSESASVAFSLPLRRRLPSLRSGSPRIIHAEKKKVRASSHRATDSGF